MGGLMIVFGILDDVESESQYNNIHLNSRQRFPNAVEICFNGTNAHSLFYIRTSIFVEIFRL